MMNKELRSGAEVSSGASSKRLWQWRPMRWQVALIIMGIVLAVGSAVILWATGGPAGKGAEAPDYLLVYNFNVIFLMLFAVWTSFSEREWPVWKRILWIIGLWIAHGFMQIIPFGIIMDRLTGGFVTNPTTIAILLSFFAMRRSTFFVEPAPPEANKKGFPAMSENENDQGDSETCQSGPGQKDNIDLFALWEVIWKRRMIIVCISGAMVAMTAVSSLLMPNIYEAKAIIMPLKKEGSIVQKDVLSGLLFSNSEVTNEIILLLKSNVLREKIINDYNLLPVLFRGQWDEQKKSWKAGRAAKIVKAGKEEGFTLNAHSLLFKLLGPVMPADKKTVKKNPGIPDIWDGLHALERIVKSDYNMIDGTVTISAESDDPVFTANLINDVINALNDYMSSEAKRVAAINKKYLEGQLQKTADPLIKEKIYNMISQQVETSMMAEVKENIFFKIIDPPRVPDKKIKPKRTTMLVSSFIVSLFLGLVTVIFLEFLARIKKWNADRLRRQGQKMP